MSEPIETRALLALYRTHPSTRPEDRYSWRARLASKERRAMLLDWAATISDYGLLGCRNLGKASLAWIRANSSSRVGLDVSELTRLIDDALEEWSIRSEPSAEVAAYLARRIAEQVVCVGAVHGDGLDAARAAVDGASCECDWMETGPDFPCVCGEHNARPYRDDVIHFRDGHARRLCAIRAALRGDNP